MVFNDGMFEEEEEWNIVLEYVIFSRIILVNVKRIIIKFLLFGKLLKKEKCFSFLNFLVYGWLFWIFFLFVYLLKYFLKCMYVFFWIKNFIIKNIIEVLFKEI